VWADRYDAKAQDLFAMEGSIGEQVAAALQVALAEPERRAISARPTTNFEAYSYFLRAEALRTAPEDALNSAPRAVAMYERAVALDPKFALAFARLSMTHNGIYWANTDRTAKRLALVRAAAETAVRLDPNLAEGHLALGFYYYWGLRDYGRALGEFSTALERQPGNGDTLGARLLRGQGRFAEAAAHGARGRARPARSGTGVQLRHARTDVTRPYPDALIPGTPEPRPREAGSRPEVSR
jgi:tetratricopeptide (TPR) repeat protein